MAKNKKKLTPLERKMQTISKLKSTGATTEKALLSISLEQMLAIQGVTIEDLRELLEVQRRVKTHTLFSWLCENDIPAGTGQAPEFNEQEEDQT